MKHDGKCPFDKWKNSNAVTIKDIAKIDAKVTAIEMVSGELAPETVKKYLTSEVDEFKISGDKKKLRPLCVKDGKKIIILCGAIEKGGKIPSGDIETAENLKKLYLEKKGSVKSYYEDQENLEQPRGQRLPRCLS